MIEKIELEMISRRRIVSFLGFAAALGFAVPTTDARAQTSGMERRQKRREGRVERRYERRGGTPASKQPVQGQSVPTPTPTQPVQK
jgi:hypothetical protein